MSTDQSDIPFSERRYAPQGGDALSKKLGRGVRPGVTPTADGMNLTDIGNGSRLAQAEQTRLRYCKAMGWLHYDGTAWRLDVKGHATELAKRTILNLYVEAARKNDQFERLALIEHAQKSEHAARVAAMLTMAQSDKRIAAGTGDFDADPWLFNTLSQTINLRTGEIYPNDRADMITKVAPVVMNPKATCDLWLSTLNTVFLGRQSLITFIQRLLGYMLTGDTSEQILPIWHGGGANGKSTIAEVVQYIMGDYAISAPKNFLNVRRGEVHPTELADLFGRRGVFAQETENGQHLDESLVKMLTGSDRIRARFVKKDFFEFTPQHKIILSTNHRPAIRGTDHAIWRRIRLVPFDYTVPDDQRDSKLARKLKREAPGILAWMIKGCRDWQKEGLTLPDEVKAATEEYKGDEDVFAKFLAECCTTKPYDKEASGDLFQAYRDYSGDRQTNQMAFTSMLQARGFAKYRGTTTPFKGKMVFEKIALIKPDSEPENNARVDTSGGF